MKYGCAKKREEEKKASARWAIFYFNTQWEE